MSLQYIVDAYNLTNHPRFKTIKTAVNIQHCLANFIRINKLTGSENNRVILVFDGYPPYGNDIPEEDGLLCMFSRKLEADELIKKIVEESTSPKNIIVISDDKQVRLMSRLLHAQICSVEEFICGKKNKKPVSARDLDLTDTKLSYSAMQKINAELKKKWLD